MESTVTIKTDEEKAEKLFDNHKTYNIRYLVRNKRAFLVTRVFWKRSIDRSCKIRENTLHLPKI